MSTLLDSLSDTGEPEIVSLTQGEPSTLFEQTHTNLYDAMEEVKVSSYFYFIKI